MKLKWISLILILILSSCGGDSEDVKNAIDEANFLLTERNCSRARTVLDEVGYQKTNPRYIAAYATTYACEANYSTVNFFADDLSKISSATDGFLGSLASFTTSDRMTAATDEDFTKLQQAINTILYSGDLTDSSSLNRINIFGSSAASNLHAQALYMVMVNFGRWLRYHGNASATGVKGAGTNPEANNCLYSYNAGGAFYAVVVDALDDGAANSGSCNSTNTPYNGTDDITNAGATLNQERLCNGIILFNNFVDLISNVTFSAANTGELNNLAANFETLCSGIGGINAALCNLRDLDDCKAANIDELEVFSAWVFERNFR